MAPDPERIREVRSWLEKANDDIRAAGVDLAADPPLTGDAAFHAQQAIEKSLKGFLSWHDVPFGKTHNLNVLSEACAKVDQSLELLMREAGPLTEYSWLFRYPGAVDSPEPKEVLAAAAISKRVYEAILNRLPPEVKPKTGSK